MTMINIIHPLHSLFTQEKAVQPVSSLPVNYSLLEIVQSTSLGADADEPPSNPTGGTTARKMPPHSGLPNSHSRSAGCTPRSSSRTHFFNKFLHNRMNQNSSRTQPMFTPASPTGYTSFPTPAATTAEEHMIRQPMYTTLGRYTSHAAGYTSFPAPATSTVQANDPNSPEAGPERELQDELDFQMAIHLTFCKVMLINFIMLEGIDLYLVILVS